MSDFSVKLEAEKLGKSLENLSEKLEAELKQAVGNLANAAYASMVAQVQASQMGQSSRKDYLKGLQFAQISDGEYMIHLDGEWANKLEDGYAGYSIKDELLASTKTVQVGERAGEPWVRTSKEGKKYAAVPFRHKPYAAKTGDLASEIKNMSAFNRQGSEQPLTKVFKDDFGKPIAGKVAKAIINEGTPGNLKGLTKYQFVSDKGNVSSLYMTFRIVHEDSNGWRHPGWIGYHFFEEAERQIEKELSNIIRTLL